MLRKNISIFVILILLSLAPGLLNTAGARSVYDPTVQTQALLYDEARTVYLGNLARRENGLPPLRWNRQLTYAARWYSWDSTENRPDGFCGHQDTQGNWPDDRALTFGYLGGAGAENAFCGYLSPEDAIQGWLDSPGHRANLLDPGSREIGLGYYQRLSDGRGYVTQDFGNDVVYAPVVIENEAISTITSAVNLYIYDRSTSGGFAGLSAATQMMVSNSADFFGATWEPYTADKSWTLASGEDWRKVYVKTRDAFGRTMTASDTIYLGANLPLDQFGVAQMSTTQPQVTLANLDGGGLPQVQFSLGWMADDTFGTFDRLWGNGERVNDTAAWGATAFRFFPGAGESSAWVWDTTFIKDTPLVAYVRLKVNDNISSNEVARITIKGGGIEYGPLSLRGTDFTAPDQYQEFPLNFTFNTNPDDAFLIIQFWGSGNADVYVDAVSIFSAPQPITSPLTWLVPGGNYRGQGVWVRYTDGIQFSDISEAVVANEVAPTFSDVPSDHPLHNYIEALYDAGYTAGCSTSPLMFCPDTILDRAQSAVFMLRGQMGSGYTPPVAPWNTFGDDWTGFEWAEPWAEGMYQEGLTQGCQSSPLMFCPSNQLPRVEASVFGLRMKYGVNYTPPAASGTLFADFPSTDPSYWAIDWAEQAYLDGLLPACGTDSGTGKPMFCPSQLVDRGWGAYLIVKAKNLPLP